MRASAALMGGRLRRHAGRYLIAVGIVAATTLLRFAVDPYLHEQLPYMLYVAAVVVATRMGGFSAGVLATVVGAFTTNYFFVTPRYEFIPHPDDWRAIATFSTVAFTVAWFVGRASRAEREVRLLHARTSTLLEQMRAATLAAEVGVWTWLPSTDELLVGANWRALFGAPADGDITRDTWARALHPEDRRRAMDALSAAWQEGGDFSAEYRVVRPDGTVRWIIDRGRAFRDAAGQIAGMTGINLDITERRVAEDALRDANRTKDEFLATLSHELRTPLNAIVGWSDMLRRGNLPPGAAARAAESIYRNAKVQNELINDVLDVARIVSGKVRIETQPIDPAVLLRNALESVRAAADAKHVTLESDLGSVPHPVAADATRIQQVFWNLLTNAVKFTPSGGRVRASLRMTGDHVQLQVADTGIGIRPDFLPHVFDRFSQHDSSSTRTHGGLGLGLAIVRHLVELHGGTVTAESAGEGRGATFTVALPAVRFDERRVGSAVLAGRAPVAAVHQAPEDAPSLSGVRILVVDDEPDAREMSASVLRHHGANVSVADSAADALQRFDEARPNVMLVDLAMPEVDGFALVRELRASPDPARAAVPAIALTAYARREDERRALANGFHRHLAKPVDSHTLVQAVAAVLREHREVA